MTHDFKRFVLDKCLITYTVLPTMNAREWDEYLVLARDRIVQLGEETWGISTSSRTVYQVIVFPTDVVDYEEYVRTKIAPSLIQKLKETK